MTNRRRLGLRLGRRSRISIAAVVLGTLVVGALAIKGSGADRMTPLTGDANAVISPSQAHPDSEKGRERDAKNAQKAAERAAKAAKDASGSSVPSELHVPSETSVQRGTGAAEQSVAPVGALSPNLPAGGPPCERVVGSGGSIQDAVDEAPRTSSGYVLCVDGTFVGGGSPPSSDRAGLGAYYGGIVVKDRSHLTVRGLANAKILGLPNDEQYPPEEASAPDQFPNDKSILVKIVDSDHVTIEGLVIDGHHYAEPTSGVAGTPVLNRLIWLQNTTDSVIRYNVIKNAGAECVRIKTHSQRNEIYRNDVANCGYYQYKVQAIEHLRKNGEAIYIGTDPFQIATSQVNKQRYYGLDPALVTDRSSYNVVHYNRLQPGPPGADWGNECVDIKEDWQQSTMPRDDRRGAPGHNVVADNECSGQFDSESGAFNARGPDNTFEHNLVRGAVTGAAIRLGGGDPKNIAGRDVKWRATGTVVRMNRLEAYGTSYAVKTFSGEPQAAGDGVCGNTDKRGGTAFGGSFARTGDARNMAKCSADTSAAGPRGAVGAP